MMTNPMRTTHTHAARLSHCAVSVFALQALLNYIEKCKIEKTDEVQLPPTSIHSGRAALPQQGATLAQP